MARNLAQRETLPNNFTYKISLMNQEKRAILFTFINFFYFRRPVQMIAILTLEHKTQMMAIKHEKSRAGNHAGLCVLPYGDCFPD